MHMQKVRRFRNILLSVAAVRKPSFESSDAVKIAVAMNVMTAAKDLLLNLASPQIP